jgi:hypothetical protein
MYATHTPIIGQPSNLQTPLFYGKQNEMCFLQLTIVEYYKNVLVSVVSCYHARTP